MVVDNLAKEVYRMNFPMRGGGVGLPGKPTEEEEEEEVIEKREILQFLHLLCETEEEEEKALGFKGMINE